MKPDNYGSISLMKIESKVLNKMLVIHIDTHQKAESHSLPNKSLTPDMKSPL